MADKDGNRSNPYHPNPEHACPACCHGSRYQHADWCEAVVVLVEEDGTRHVFPDFNTPRIVDLQIGREAALTTGSRTRLTREIAEHQRKLRAILLSAPILPGDIHT